MHLLVRRNKGVLSSILSCVFSLFGRRQALPLDWHRSAFVVCFWRVLCVWLETATAVVLPPGRSSPELSAGAFLNRS